MKEENINLLKRIIREEFDNCPKINEIDIIEMAKDMEESLRLNNDFSLELEMDKS